MTIEVKQQDANEFFDEHCKEQNRLKSIASAEVMEVRLRPYFPVAMGHKTFIFSVEMDGKVVGVSECLATQEGADMLSLSYISVDENYRKRGIASAIFSKIVDYALESGYKAIDSSYFTDSGELYLRGVMQRHLSRIKIYVDGKPLRSHKPSP